MHIIIIMLNRATFFLSLSLFLLLSIKKLLLQQTYSKSSPSRFAPIFENIYLYK